MSNTALGRHALDFDRLGTIAPAIRARRPDAVVNAAAFTAVNLAESQEVTAQLLNVAAAGGRRDGQPCNFDEFSLHDAPWRAMGDHGGRHRA